MIITTKPASPLGFPFLIHTLSVSPMRTTNGDRPDPDGSRKVSVLVHLRWSHFLVGNHYHIYNVERLRSRDVIYVLLPRLYLIL